MEQQPPVEIRTPPDVVVFMWKWTLGNKDALFQTSGYLNLLANCIDNFTHGLAVAGSFLVSKKVRCRAKVQTIPPSELQQDGTESPNTNQITKARDHQKKNRVSTWSHKCYIFHLTLDLSQLIVKLPVPVRLGSSEYDSSVFWFGVTHVSMNSTLPRVKQQSDNMWVTRPHCWLIQSINWAVVEHRLVQKSQTASKSNRECSTQMCLLQCGSSCRKEGRL